MKIYIVKYEDYDGSNTAGYFTEHEKAELCCEYLNKAYPSHYFENAWDIEEFDPDDTDYECLIKEFDAKEKIRKENELEALKQKKMNEIKQLNIELELLNKQLKS